MHMQLVKFKYMISIIISSAKKDLLSQVSINIANTIGVEYEILSYENSKGEKGMCEIYNLGAARAKYNILCYMHEDVDIKTPNWGTAVLDVFNSDDTIGVVGVAGSNYKSSIPSGWNAHNIKDDLVSYNFIQTFKRDPEKPSIHHYANPHRKYLIPVLCVDGLWFCTTKKVALTHRFDQDLLKGFHCYDIDYCLQVNQTHKVVVTYNVLIEHFSEGGYNKDWFVETLKLHHKWQQSLPMSLYTVPDDQVKIIDKRAYKWLLERFVEMGYKLSEIIQFLKKTRRENNLDKKLYRKLVFYAFSYTPFNERFSLKVFKSLLH